jgi:accessory gene regulator protein AgrB
MVCFRALFNSINCLLVSLRIYVFIRFGENFFDFLSESITCFFNGDLCGYTVMSSSTKFVHDLEFRSIGKYSFILMYILFALCTLFLVQSCQ